MIVGERSTGSVIIRDLPLLIQPVGKHYLNAKLLANCHTCLYGNPTSQRFGVRPPTLEECFALEEVELPAREI